MGFYKNIGLKHLEDLEDYIKTKGWTDQSVDSIPLEKERYWCADSETESYIMYRSSLNVIWTIKKDGDRWFIRETAIIRGGRSYNNIDITEEIADMYNAMLANQPIYINIEKGLDCDTQANHGKFHIGTLKLKTTVEIAVEPGKEDIINNLPWRTKEKTSILLEDEFTSKIIFKLKAYCTVPESEIRDIRKQWNYASRQARR